MALFHITFYGFALVLNSYLTVDMNSLKLQFVQIHFFALCSVCSATIIAVSLRSFAIRSSIFHSVKMFFLRVVRFWTSFCFVACCHIAYCHMRCALSCSSFIHFVFELWLMIWCVVYHVSSCTVLLQWSFWSRILSCCIVSRWVLGHLENFHYGPGSSMFDWHVVCLSLSSCLILYWVLLRCTSW